MPQHHQRKLLVAITSPLLIQEGINQHYRIKEPTQISDTVRKAGIHTKHPNAIKAQVQIE